MTTGWLFDNPEAITPDRADGSRGRFAPLSVDRIDRKAESGRIDRKGPSFAHNAFWPIVAPEYANTCLNAIRDKGGPFVGIVRRVPNYRPQVIRAPAVWQCGMVGGDCRVGHGTCYPSRAASLNVGVRVYVMAEIRTQLAWHTEWLCKLLSFGCPRWKLEQVRSQCDELAQAYEWALFDSANR